MLHEDESGWWTGRIENTGVEGVFPSNFTDPYEPETQNEENDEEYEEENSVSSVSLSSISQILIIFF